MHHQKGVKEKMGGAWQDPMYVRISGKNGAFGIITIGLAGDQIRGLNYERRLNIV